MNFSVVLMVIASILLFLSALQPFFVPEPSKYHLFRWGMFCWALAVTWGMIGGIKF